VRVALVMCFVAGLTLGAACGGGARHQTVAGAMTCLSSHKGLMVLRIGPQAIGRLAFDSKTEAGVSASNLLSPDYFRSPKLAWMYFEQDEAAAQERIRTEASAADEGTRVIRRGRVILSVTTRDESFRSFVHRCITSS
jgi:hypothetical protein